MLIIILINKIYIYLCNFSFENYISFWIIFKLVIKDILDLYLWVIYVYNNIYIDNYLSLYWYLLELKLIIFINLWNLNFGLKSKDWKIILSLF